MCVSKKKRKASQFFICKLSFFTVVKYCSMLHRHVFVMNFYLQKNEKASSSSKHDKSTEAVDWQLGKSVTESISIAQNCDAWSDVSFRCRDQDETDDPIKAHKFILASRSPVFEAMFFGLLKETQQVIRLEDVSLDTFKALLRYCK